jgi:hypothetical protein
MIGFAQPPLIYWILNVICQNHFIASFNCEGKLMGILSIIPPPDNYCLIQYSIQ